MTSDDVLGEQNMLTERTSDAEKWSEYEEPWVASIDPKALKAGVIYDLLYVEVSIIPNALPTEPTCLTWPVHHVVLG
eukprot:3489524-Rhodomonas_salina.3